MLARYPQVLAIVDDHFALLSATPWHSLFLQAPTLGAGALDVKTLGPDLRLAFIASDAATSAALRLRLNAGSQWVSHLLQDLTLACLTDEAFIASMTETVVTIASRMRNWRRRWPGTASAMLRRMASGCRCQRRALRLRLARAGWLVREERCLASVRPPTGYACRWAV